MFGVNTPQAFYDRLIATQADPKTGKPDPEKMAAFLESHPETVTATKIIQSHPASSGFDNSPYYGLNAFWFVDASGASIAGALVDGAGRSRLYPRIRPGQPKGTKITFLMR